MVPFDDDSERLSFFDEDGSQSPSSESFQNSDNLANVQQWPGDEWAFFSDGELEQEPELWIEIASIEPVVANRPPDALVDDIVDWWDDYEDPIVSDAEWSGPIQPNAPPTQVFDDPWDFDSEQALESAATADSFQNADVPSSSPYDDAWDWDADLAAYDETFGISQALGADAVQNTAQLPQDSEWIDEDVEDYELLIDDFANFELDPPQSDVWDWDADAAFEDSSVDLEQTLGADVPSPIPFDDAWDWDTDAAIEDAIDLDQPIGPNAVVVASQPPDDSWDWDSEQSVDESADLPEQALGADVIVQSPQDPDWVDDDVGDDYESALEAVLSPDLVVAPSQPLDDPWDWDTENALDESSDVTDQLLSADVVANPPIPSADAWDWDTEQFVDESVDFVEQFVDVFIAQPSDPEWIDDDVADDYEITQDAAAPVPDLPSPVFDDAWDWESDSFFDESAQIVEQILNADASQPQDPEWNDDDVIDDYESALDAFNGSADPIERYEDPWDFSSEWTDDPLDVDQSIGPTYRKGELIPLPPDDRRIVIVGDDRRIYPIPSS